MAPDYHYYDHMYTAGDYGRSNAAPSSADREATVAALREHYAAGHLDLAAFEDRVSSTMTASSLGALHALVADLPGAPRRHTAAPVAAGRYMAAYPNARHMAPYRGARHMAPYPGAYLPLLIVPLLLIAMAGAHAFWLIFPLMFFMMRGPFIGWPARRAYARWYR